MKLTKEEGRRSVNRRQANIFVQGPVLKRLMNSDYGHYVLNAPLQRFICEQIVEVKGVAMSQQVVRGRKFAQVLEGARTVFLREGFEGAAVDEIARESGVSKATLYSYFSDKRLMFTEVFRRELARDLAEAEGVSSVDAAVTTVLPMIGSQIAHHLVSDFGIRTLRLCIGEAGRFPELARDYYHAGPLEVRARLMTYFELCNARGELAIAPDELDLAADQFLELCSAIVQDRAQFLGGDSVDEAMISRVVSGAVRMFLAAYAPKTN